MTNPMNVWVSTALAHYSQLLACLFAQYISPAAASNASLVGLFQMSWLLRRRSTERSATGSTWPSSNFMATKPLNSALLRQQAQKSSERLQAFARGAQCVDQRLEHVGRAPHNLSCVFQMNLFTKRRSTSTFATTSTRPSRNLSTKPLRILTTMHLHTSHYFYANIIVV